MDQASNALRPRLVPRAAHYAVGDDGVLLVTESEGVFALQGAFWTRLLPMLDGTRAASQIAKSLSDPKEIIELYRGLFLLKARGLLLDGPAPQEAAPLFWHAGSSAPVVVRIEKVGRADDAPLRRILEMAEIGMECHAPVTVVVTDDYRQPALGDINRRQLELGKPWLLMKCQGWRSWVGPVFTPEVGPCWECLYSRLKVNMMEIEYAEALGSGNGTSQVAGTASTRMLLALAAPVIERVCLTGDAGALVNTIWTFDLHTMSQESHHVMRLPQCSSCGNPQLAGASDEFQLQSRKTGGSGYRSNSPWLTHERFRHHVSAISGAVPELRPGLLEENPFHLFTAGINPTRQVSSARDLMRFSLRTRSAGKGPTREQAIAGALAEALERYSCTWRGDARAVRCRMADLGDTAVDPRSILNYSAAQYAARAEINARGETFYTVPQAFDPGEIMEWTPVRSLTHQHRLYVPTAMCWFRYSAASAAADSNGCAAGNNLEEAIQQGLCELIERDAAAIWWYNQLRLPGIDLATLDDPWCAAMIATFRKEYGRSVWAIDLSNDLGVPAAVVVSALEDPECPEYFFGFGCHLDAGLAVRRAFSEMCQFFGGMAARAGARRGSFADVCRNADNSMSRWLSRTTSGSQPQMTPAPGVSRKISDLASLASGDLLDDIRLLTFRLASRGIEVLALDCTQPDIGMPVARVFAPGLRHFWPRFGPGRLYETPVQQGWLAQPKREDELNPVAMFI